MPLLSVQFCVGGAVAVVAVVGACAAELPGTSACAATIAAAAASRISRLIPNPLVAKSQLHWASPRSPLRPEPSSSGAVTCGLSTLFTCRQVCQEIASLPPGGSYRLDICGDDRRDRPDQV